MLTNLMSKPSRFTDCGTARVENRLCSNKNHFRFIIVYLGSTSRAGFILIWGVSLTHPMLASFLSGEFLLHIPCWIHLYLGRFSYISYAGFIFYFFINLGSFSYTFCTSFLSGEFLSGEFLLHIPCLLYFSVGSFYYASHAGFLF